jgi:hypothetical protein
MLSNADYGRLQVKAVVTDGTLTLGIHEGGSKNWICFDNFRLTYSATATDISLPMTAASQADAAYDLQGRKLSKAPHRGVYIINGKKILSTK